MRLRRPPACREGLRPGAHVSPALAASCERGLSVCDRRRPGRSRARRLGRPTLLIAERVPLAAVGLAILGCLICAGALLFAVLTADGAHHTLPVPAPEGPSLARVGVDPLPSGRAVSLKQALETFASQTRLPEPFLPQQRAGFNVWKMWVSPVSGPEVIVDYCDGVRVRVVREDAGTRRLERTVTNERHSWLSDARRWGKGVGAVATFYGVPVEILYGNGTPIQGGGGVSVVNGTTVSFFVAGPQYSVTASASVPKDQAMRAARSVLAQFAIANPDAS